MSPCLMRLFVTKPDIFCIPCKLRVCKFPKNSIDVNYMHPEIKDQGMKVSEDFLCLILNLRTCTVVIHTILWKFANLRLTSPSGPIRSCFPPLCDFFHNTLLCLSSPAILAVGNSELFPDGTPRNQSRASYGKPAGRMNTPAAVSTSDS